MKTKVALIEGIAVKVPVEAKFVFQCPRGVWFWSDISPKTIVRSKKDSTKVDWWTQKTPIQIKNPQGFDRAFITSPRTGADWQNTIKSLDA